jgi:hypothetical protein
MNDNDKYMKVSTQTHQALLRETPTIFLSHGPARTRSTAAAHRRGIIGPARAHSSAAAHRRGTMGYFAYRESST